MSINDLLTLSISELHSIYGGAKKHKNIIEIEEDEYEENDEYETGETHEDDEIDKLLDDEETNILENEILGGNILDTEYDEILGGNILDDEPEILGGLILDEDHDILKDGLLDEEDLFDENDLDILEGETTLDF